MYDYLIVGSGLFGATFAFEAKKRGKQVLLIERRPHIAGNIYTEEQEGITVHKYGAHIFHTKNLDIWNYIRQFSTFNHYQNSPLASVNGKLFNLPFNMNTFYQLWGCTSPIEAQNIIREQVSAANISRPAKNLEEQAILLVGKDIYELLIKNYTEKQWGRPCKELPAFIIKRLPLRFTFDNNYFSDPYQGIPCNGYTTIVEQMLENIEVKLLVDFQEEQASLRKLAKKIIYTGMLDKFYDYKLGKLEYRSLRFEHEVLDTPNYQGNAVVNFTGKAEPYTRIIEHKHFAFGTQSKSVISKEYSVAHDESNEPYYPINNPANNDLYQSYTKLASQDKDIFFKGRLGAYKYYNMDEVIAAALELINELEV